MPLPYSISDVWRVGRIRHAAYRLVVAFAADAATRYSLSTPWCQNNRLGGTGDVHGTKYQTSAVQSNAPAFVLPKL